MLGDIDLKKKPVKPQIFLAKPNRTIIAKLNEAHDIVFNKRLGSLNELSFSIPYEIDVNHEFVRNVHVDLVRHRYLLKLVLGKYEEWFIIDSPEDSMTEDGDIKKINAFSLGFELNDKMVRAYKENSKNASQALLDALKYTLWNIGSIDAQFDVKFRSFDVSSKTVLDFVYEIAETFNALILWDTQNRRIHFYNHTLVGNNRGLKLSYGKYLKSLDREIQPDEMTTRLKVYGKDNLSIQRVNSTGTDYIENFGYFMYPFQRDTNRNVLSSSLYMTDELCHAILDYTKLLEDNKTTFSLYLKELEDIQKVLSIEQQKLVTLQTELQKIEDNIFVSDKAGPYPTGRYESQKIAKEQEIAAQKIVVQNVQVQVNAALTKINQLKVKLSVEANFTPELIKERNQYIIEKEWVNEQIISDKDLLDAGLKVFEEFSKPKTVISMDIVNFLEVIEEQRNWDKLNLGDTIVISYEKLGINVSAKIIEIEYDYNDANIKLTIANVTDIESNEEKFIKSLYRNSSSTKVDMSKFKWDKYENDLGDISKVLEEFWNKAKQQIDMAVNETVIIDRTGITIKDEADPLRFLRLTHGAIGLTKSGGNRYETALTPDGLIAERVFGRIITGERVIVGDPDGILEIRGNKMVITDRNGREVMWMGLFDTNPDRFGIKLENDTNQVIMDRDEGFVIARKKNGSWDKIIWLDLQGYIHAKGLKLHGSKSEIILDAEEGIIDLRPLEGYLGQEIRLSIEDGITVTRANKNKIWLNADKGISIDRYDGGSWTSVFYVDLDGNIVCNDIKANNMFAKNLTIENDNGLITLKPDEGIKITRKDKQVVIGLNADDGIYIDNDGDRKFWVDPDGILHAKDLIAESLLLVGSNGKILLDANQRILNLENFDMIIGSLEAQNVISTFFDTEFGAINDLTVNRLRTVKRDQLGLVDFIDIQDNYMRWVTAVATESGNQAQDSKGRPLYWLDSKKNRVTTEDTGIPVYLIDYNTERYDKLSMFFEGTGYDSYPIMIWGAGSGVGDAEKVKMFKRGQEFIVEYTSSASTGSLKRTFKLNDNGANIKIATQNGELLFDMNNTGQIKVQNGFGSFIDLNKDVHIHSSGNMKLTSTGRMDLN
ncbi:phage tail protein [Brevibacillus porteri]|uniref:phage tail protein n=1 Tax=Brevibacillus porteri TaxID=2126350 RepID=UPI003628BB40